MASREEFLKDMSYKSIREVRDAIAMMTPVQAAKCNGEHKKRWHIYRDEPIKKDTELGKS